MVSNIVTALIIALSIKKAFAGVSWTGINISGFDFGCSIDGTCTITSIVPPLLQYKGKDGAAQMDHFAKQDGFNAFRLPVAWQFLVNNKCGADLDSVNFAKYDDLVKACLVTGSYCIIDIHNYARWNGQIIGQGGPVNDDLTSLWSQLAKKYAQEPKVVMGIMNEPHGVDIELWAATVQAAVTAIRKAGATDHYILLPGNGYTNVAEFPTGSAPALGKVTNLDGSTTNLIFDVHKYLDSDNSGTHANCVSDGIAAAFAPLADYLRKNNRIALLSEIGGGVNDQSCFINVCKALAYLDQNSDVYLGYLGWGAGSFDETYILSLTPLGDAQTGFTDQPLITKCFASKTGKFYSSPQSSSAALYTPPPSTEPAGYSKAQPTATPPAGYINTAPATPSVTDIHVLEYVAPTTTALVAAGVFHSNPPSSLANHNKAKAVNPSATIEIHPQGYDNIQMYGPTTATVAVTTANPSTPPSSIKLGNAAVSFSSGEKAVFTYSASVTSNILPEYGYGALTPAAYSPTTFSTAVKPAPSQAAESGGENDDEEDDVCEL